MFGGGRVGITTVSANVANAANANATAANFLI
jgi:hypothetical protein